MFVFHPFLPLNARVRFPPIPDARHLAAVVSTSGCELRVHGRSEPVSFEPTIPMAFWYPSPSERGPWANGGNGWKADIREGEF